MRLNRSRLINRSLRYLHSVPWVLPVSLWNSKSTLSRVPTQPQRQDNLEKGKWLLGFDPLLSDYVTLCSQNSTGSSKARCMIPCHCPKLSFYIVLWQGALPIKLCTRKLLHAPSQYIAIINGSENVHTRGAHLLKSCTRPWKCARRVHP